MEHILQKSLKFSKNYLKIFNFSIFLKGPYKSREISDEFYYQLRNLSKSSINSFDRGTIGNGMQILENFRENRLKFVEKFKIIKSWRINSIEHGELRFLGANICAFDPKVKKTLKFFKKILRFFNQNLYGKLTFFTNFY